MKRSLNCKVWMKSLKAIDAKKKKKTILKTDWNVTRAWMLTEYSIIVLIFFALAHYLWLFFISHFFLFTVCILDCHYRCISRDLFIWASRCITVIKPSNESNLFTCNIHECCWRCKSSSWKCIRSYLFKINKSPFQRIFFISHCKLFSFLFLLFAFIHFHRNKR